MGSRFSNDDVIHKLFLSKYVTKMQFPISIFLQSQFSSTIKWRLFLCYMFVTWESKIKFNTATKFSFDSSVTYTKFPPFPLQQIRFRVAVKVFPPRRQTDEHQLASKCPGVCQCHTSQHWPRGAEDVTQTSLHQSRVPARKKHDPDHCYCLLLCEYLQGLLSTTQCLFIVCLPVHISDALIGIGPYSILAY